MPVDLTSRVFASNCIDADYLCYLDRIPKRVLFCAAIKIQAVWRGVLTRIAFIWKLRESYERISWSLDHEFSLLSSEGACPTIKNIWQPVIRNVKEVKTSLCIPRWKIEAGDIDTKSIDCPEISQSPKSSTQLPSLTNKSQMLSQSDIQGRIAELDKRKTAALIALRESQEALRNRILEIV